MNARPEAAADPIGETQNRLHNRAKVRGRQASDIFAIAVLHRIASTIGRNTNCRHAQSATDLIDVFNLLHFFVFFVSFCSKMSPLPYTRYSPKLIGSTVGQGRSQQMTAGTSLLSFVTCASYDITLRSNLLASACLAPDWRTGHRNQELPERRGWAQHRNRTGRDGMGRLRSSRRLAAGGMGPMRFRTTR